MITILQTLEKTIRKLCEIENRLPVSRKAPFLLFDHLLIKVLMYFVPISN